MSNNTSSMVSASSTPSSDALSPWRHLLAIDSAAGATVGVLMLVAHPLLSDLYALPASLLIRTGLVNLAYAACSGTLARLRTRSTRMVETMAIANVLWAPVCLLLAWRFRDTASPYGLAALSGEAVFVVTLGALEWRYRRVLTLGSDSAQVPPNHS